MISHVYFVNKSTLVRKFLCPKVDNYFLSNKKSEKLLIRINTNLLIV